MVKIRGANSETTVCGWVSGSKNVDHSLQE